MSGPDPMLPHAMTVTRVRRETADTWTLEGERPAALAGFAAGQFNMLYAFGVGEVPVSISGSPDQPGRLVHTVRAVGPVSTAIARMGKGGVLGVRGPYGAGWPVQAAQGDDVVLVAGGLGLAPLRPALYHVLARRERYGRVFLLYGARAPAEILYRRELTSWRRRLDLEVAVTVDRADTSWHGNVGVVTTLVQRAGIDPEHVLAMICGPEMMMRFSVAALEQAGVPRGRMYVSMERNMKCALGLCGHCQFGPHFVCADGPVLCFDRVAGLLPVREL